MLVCQINKRTISIVQNSLLKFFNRFLHQKNFKHFVNGLYCPEGGSPITGAKTALTTQMKKLSKKEFDPELIRKGLVYAINCKVAEPSFANQTKSKINNPNLRTLASQAFKEGLEMFAQTSEFDTIVEMLTKIQRAIMGDWVEWKPEQGGQHPHGLLRLYIGQTHHARQHAGGGQQQRQHRVLPSLGQIRRHGVGVESLHAALLLHGAGLRFLHTPRRGAPQIRQTEAFPPAGAPQIDAPLAAKYHQCRRSRQRRMRPAFKKAPYAVAQTYQGQQKCSSRAGKTFFPQISDHIPPQGQGKKGLQQQ